MKEDRAYNGNNTATAVLEKRCQGCGRQCPLNALACERGRHLNGGIGMEERNEQYEGNNGHKRHEGHLEGKAHGCLARHVHHDKEESYNGHNSHAHHNLHKREDIEPHKHDDIDFHKHDKRHCNHGMHDYDTKAFQKRDGKRHSHEEKRHLPFDTEETGAKGLFARLRECGHYLFHLQGHNIGQNRIIRELAEQGGELSQREITEMLHLQRASVSEILGKLENRQLLQREQSETDKRSQMVKLTKEGRQMAESLAEAELKDRDSLFQSLTEEEKTQLHGILGKLLDSWRKQS